MFWHGNQVAFGDQPGLGLFYCFAYLRKVSKVSFIAGIRFVFFDGENPIW